MYEMTYTLNKLYSVFHMLFVTMNTYGLKTIMGG